MTESVVANSVLFDEAEVGQAVRLRASRCPACGRWEFPARTYCPACDGVPQEEPLSSAATVRLVSAVLHQPPGALVTAPYAVVLADFPEGLSVMGVVADVAFDRIQVGDALTTVATRIGETTGYQYRLATP